MYMMFRLVERFSWGLCGFLLAVFANCPRPHPSRIYPHALGCPALMLLPLLQVDTMMFSHAQHSSDAGCASLASPFQCPSVSPVSSNSAGTAVGAPSCTVSQSSSPHAAGSCAETAYSGHASQPQQQGYASMMAGSGSKRFNASRYIQDKEWLYRLITFPSYFTPCPSCCGGARTPKREQLMTQFDTEYPYRVYCSHCPECKDRVNSGCLLQVRRSAFKDVVKATDIQRYGADVAGVQQYTLNGSKVIYLNREQTPEKKGNNTNAAPAACSVDGRAMMDKSSCYCSLKCKLIAEDPGFTSWLDTQDPSVRILAQAAANAPPKPTAASKKAAQPTSSASSGGSGACSPMFGDNGGVTSASRPLKLARTDSTGATVSAGRPAGLPLQRAASASNPAAPTGLKRIRISLPGKRQQSAPSGLIEAALAEPQAAGAGTSTAAAAAAIASGNWLDMDNTLSCSAAWEGWDLDSSLDSPIFSAGTKRSFTTATEVPENDGSMSPALIHAPSVFSTGSADDWWLCGSPMEGAFTCAGMGALLNTDAGVGAGADDGCVFGGLDSLSGAMLLPSVGPAGAASPVSSLGAETTTAGLQCW